MRAASIRGMDTGFVRRLLGHEPTRTTEEFAGFAKEKLQLSDAIKPQVEKGLADGSIQAKLSSYTTGQVTGTRVQLTVGGKELPVMDVGVVNGAYGKGGPTVAAQAEATARALALADKGPKTAPEVARFTESARARLAVSAPRIGGAVGGVARAVSPLSMVTGVVADYVEAGRHAQDPAIVREYVRALQDGRGVPLAAKLNPELDKAIRDELRRQNMLEV